MVRSQVTCASTAEKPKTPQSAVKSAKRDNMMSSIGVRQSPRLAAIAKVQNPFCTPQVMPSMSVLPLNQLSNVRCSVIFIDCGRICVRVLTVYSIQVTGFSTLPRPYLNCFLVLYMSVFGILLCMDVVLSDVHCFFYMLTLCRYFYLLLIQ